MTALFHHALTPSLDTTLPTKSFDDSNRLLSDAEIDTLLNAPLTSDYESDDEALIDSSPEEVLLDWDEMDTANLCFDEDGLIVDDTTPQLNPTSFSSSSCTPSLCLTFQNDPYYFSFSPSTTQQHQDSDINEWDPVILSSPLTLFVLQLKSVFQIECKVVVVFPQLDITIDEVRFAIPAHIVSFPGRLECHKDPEQVKLLAGSK
ncbi:hypothetical protein HDU98_009470 [Podochytrium sp. JEL0797]|nr:hypothetical protein HDU98_009470 [Podochytrium sp. JEL0797]